MPTIDELAAQLGLTPEALKEELAIIGLVTTRGVAEQLADADAVEQKGFEAVLQEPAIEPEHWRKALQRLGARTGGEGSGGEA
jgi:hypothetical protein